MSSDITDHPVHSMKSILQDLGLGKRKNPQLVILKYIYLNFETSVKREKGKEGKKERRKKYNRKANMLTIII